MSEKFGMQKWPIFEELLKAFGDCKIFINKSAAIHDLKVNISPIIRILLTAVMENMIGPLNYNMFSTEVKSLKCRSGQYFNNLLRLSGSAKYSSISPLLLMI